MSNIKPMTVEQTRARTRLVSKLVVNQKLGIIDGIKRGRTAYYQGTDENPWLLKVLIDRVPRVVRWDWVTT